jgi:hypothetical protein
VAGAHANHSIGSGHTMGRLGLSNLGGHISVSEVDLATAMSKSVHDRMRRRKIDEPGRKLVDSHRAAKAVAGLRRETL